MRPHILSFIISIASFVVSAVTAYLLYVLMASIGTEEQGFSRILYVALGVVVFIINLSSTASSMFSSIKTILSNVLTFRIAGIILTVISVGVLVFSICTAIEFFKVI